MLQSNTASRRGTQHPGARLRDRGDQAAPIPEVDRDATRPADRLFAAADVRQRPLVTGKQAAQIVGIFVGISAFHIELLL
jgi:hypothetical protein